MTSKLGKQSITTVVRNALDTIHVGEDGIQQSLDSILGKKIVSMALGGDVNMIRLIWNYTDGMPQQKVDHTSNGQPIVLNFDPAFSKTQKAALEPQKVAKKKHDTAPNTARSNTKSR